MRLLALSVGSRRFALGACLWASGAPAGVLPCLPTVFATSWGRHDGIAGYSDRFDGPLAAKVPKGRERALISKHHAQCDSL